MYDNGQGVPEDDAEAVRWYRLAADQGNATAQFNLGVMYDTGRGVPQDDAEAVRWYRLAADQGDADAQFNLGFISEKCPHALSLERDAHAPQRQRTVRQLAYS